MNKEEQAEYDKILKACTPQVAKIAEEAVKQDGWMVPTEDNIELPYDGYEQKERDGWSETDQYHIRWQSRIISLVQDAVDASEVFNGDRDAYLELRLELEDVFWEEWFTGHRLYNFWKRRNKKARASA